MVCFQWLENQISQLAIQVLDPEHTGRADAFVIGRSFRDLVRSTDLAFARHVDLVDVDNASEHKAKFHALMKRCEAVSQSRNRLVHSTYLHVEAGGELQTILRSKPGVRTGGAQGPRVEFDRAELSESSFQEHIRGAADCGFEVGQARVQIVHWLGRA